MPHYYTDITCNSWDTRQPLWGARHHEELVIDNGRTSIIRAGVGQEGRGAGGTCEKAAGQARGGHRQIRAGAFVYMRVGAAGFIRGSW